MTYNNYKKYLSFIGIAIFLYLLIKIDISNIISEIRKADLFFLLIAFILVFTSFITQTAKWFFIARTQKIKIPFNDAFKINFISNFYGFVTPSRIGGVIRADYLRKYKNGSLGKGLSNYSIDKTLDLISLAFLAAVFSFVFKDIIGIFYFYYAFLGMVLIIFFLFIFRDENRIKPVLRFFYRRILPEKIKDRARKEFHSFYKDMPKKRHLLIFFALNVFNWTVLYVSDYFIGLSLGIEVSVFYFLAILPISTLIAQIPITISGLGTREATMISLFALAGVGATKVFSMALIALFVGGVVPAIIGSFLNLISLKTDRWQRKSQ